MTLHRTTEVPFLQPQLATITLQKKKKLKQYTFYFLFIFYTTTEVSECIFIFIMNGNITIIISIIINKKRKVCLLNDLLALLVRWWRDTLCGHHGQCWCWGRMLHHGIASHGDPEGNTIVTWQIMYCTVLLIKFISTGLLTGGKIIELFVFYSRLHNFNW